TKPFASEKINNTANLVMPMRKSGAVSTLHTLVYDNSIIRSFRHGWRPEVNMPRSRSWLLVVLSCTVLATGQNSEQSILSYNQYSAIEYRNPYVLEFKTDSGALLFFG